jgi:Uma2 family endonuclease
LELRCPENASAVPITLILLASGPEEIAPKNSREPAGTGRLQTELSSTTTSTLPHPAPDVVLEIRSPGDESHEKLEFYARIGVPEVWIVDRDSKAPEVYILAGGKYVIQSASGNGWIMSPATGIELRAGSPGRLTLRLAGNDTTLQNLP